MARPSNRGTRSEAPTLPDGSKWPGRVYVKADGTRVYEIRKQVNGHRYEVSTGATTFKAAVKQLERFESDPEVYRPLGDTGIAPVYLDNDLSESFLSWSLKAQRDGGKENSAMWVEKKRSILVWWMKQPTESPSSLPRQESRW